MRALTVCTLLMCPFLGARAVWAQGAPPDSPIEPGADPAAEPAAAAEPTAPAEPARVPPPPPPPPPPGAQPAQGPAGYYEPAPPTPPVMKGARVHDGFYLRLGLGGGSLRGEGETTSPDSEYTLQGGALAFDLMIGGSPSDGLVIGGAYWFNQAPSASSETDLAGTQDAELLFNFGVLGIFIDGFFDPEGGFHLGGMLGVAVSQLSNADSGSADQSYSGGAAGIFAGYDFWIADEWSLGAMLRLSGARVDNTDEDREDTMNVSSIALLFTGLYH